MVDLLILITALIIGVMAPISSILREILLITTGITIILFMFLIIGGKILGTVS